MELFPPYEVRVNQPGAALAVIAAFPAAPTLFQMINFDQSHASSIAFAADDGGVRAGCQVCKNRRFTSVFRRNPSRLNDCCVCICPVIVESDRRPTGIV